MLFGRSRELPFKLFEGSGEACLARDGVHLDFDALDFRFPNLVDFLRCHAGGRESPYQQGIGFASAG